MLERTVRKGLLFVVLAVLALSGLGAAPPNERGNSAAHSPDRILVKFQPGTDAATAAATHRKNGGTVINTIPQIDVQVVTVPAGTVRAKVADYGHSANVQYAEPDYIAYAVGKPTQPPIPTVTADPDWGKQWGMQKVNASQAWAITKGDGVKIAILDTGIDQNHSDLSSKIVAQKNFTGPETPDDRYGHGTHVAGIASAITNNKIGVAGLGYNAVLMNGKVLGDDGSGYYSWIANGVIWAVDNGAKVINMSLGGGADDTTLRNAVDYAWGNDVVVVAAAGNDGTSSPFYPAYYKNSIAVAATDSRDLRASWSNFGSAWVDVAAPGVDIYSTINTGSYGNMSGTSMASPHVAGLAVLVWSIPQYGTSSGSVRSRIESGAIRKTAGATGTQWGRIDAYNAVR